MNGLCGLVRPAVPGNLSGQVPKVTLLVPFRRLTRPRAPRTIW